MRESQREGIRERVRKETEDHLTGAVDLKKKISFQSWNMPVSLQIFDTSVFVCVCVHVDRYSILLK